MNLQTSETLANSALDDIYKAIRIAVKSMVRGVNLICIMTNDWTNKYKAKPYLGVRLNFLKDWSYEAVTLGCQVVPSHTARAVANHVSSILKYFLDQVLKNMFATSCHKDAANMVAASQLLKVDNF